VHWKATKTLVSEPIGNTRATHVAAFGSRLLVTYVPAGGGLRAVSSADSGATTHSADISTSTSSSWSGVALRGATARAIFTLVSGAIYMRVSSDGGRTWHEGGTVDIPDQKDASLSLGMGTRGFVATWYESVDPPSAGGTVHSRHGT
jgi:hypothetical protein